MPRGARRIPRSPAVIAAALAAVVIVLGVVLWFLPHLTYRGQHIAEVPTPPALFGLTEFPVAPGQTACMNKITITPESAYTEFDLRPAKAGTTGPPVEVVLSGNGYRSVVQVPGGYPGGSVALPMASPHNEVIGTVCFINRGKNEVLLDGTDEPRTVAVRTATFVGDQTVAGDIALTFLARGTRPRSNAWAKSSATPPTSPAGSCRCGCSGSSPSSPRSGFPRRSSRPSIWAWRMNPQAAGRAAFRARPGARRRTTKASAADR